MADTPDALPLLREIQAAAALVLQGFDQRLFVRNIELDTDPAWAIKQWPYIRALARLKQLVDTGGA